MEEAAAANRQFKSSQEEKSKNGSMNQDPGSKCHRKSQC
jgi:hypothetical protein